MANRDRIALRRVGLTTALTNFALTLILLAVGFACFYGVDGTVSAEGEQNVYRSGTRGFKTVCLTFNVYENTEVVYEILNVLREENAKATFFVGGCWADDNEKCLKDILSNGHEIGNHGYFHKDHATLSFENNRAEIDSCNRVVESLCGVQPKLFAPPSGAYSKNTLIAAEKAGMKVILWSKDTIDWRDRDTSLIFRRATEGVCDGDIILMHPKKHTAIALKDILTFYKTHSLQTVTISENLGLAKQAQ